MIEKHYILDEKNFKIKEAYIEPEHEWYYWVIDNKDTKVKCFNDINPETGLRTGKSYPEYTVFSLVSEARQGLKKYIEELIEKNREKIGKLQDKNLEYLDLLQKENLINL